MRPFPVIKLCMYIGLFCLLAACSPLQATSVIGDTNATTVPVSTVIPTISTRLTITPAIPTLDVKSMKTITLDQKNKTITLKVGESFLLNLGVDIYQWDVSVDYPTIVSRVLNVAVVRGAQGIYQAHQIGKATLSASGDPLCRQSKPPCGMPSILFILNIEVID